MHFVHSLFCTINDSINKMKKFVVFSSLGVRSSSVVRVFAHGAMGRRINPSWGEPIELFLVLASAPRLV